MKFIETSLPGVILIEPRVYDDDRGFFMETYHSEKFSRGGITGTFVQDNHARSSKGVLRGLHYQIKHAQGKLMRAIVGEVYDVAVDIRRDSPHFGEWVGITLSAENKNQLYIPPGFAHGYYVLSDVAEIVYKCTDLYHPEYERGILWSDQEIGIDWPGRQPVLSDKDRQLPRLNEAELF